MLSRRLLGPALVGTGIFLIVLAVAMPTVAYPRLAILPLDPQVTQVASGEGFDVILPRNVDDGGTKIYRDVPVTATVTVARDPNGQDGPDHATWQVATETEVGDLGLLQVTVEGVSLNRHTSLAANCCNSDYMLTEAGDDEGEPMPHRGYVFQFPFNTQKTTYPMWDANIEDTVPTRFVAEEERRGFDTYRFEQEVTDQKVGTRELPGELYDIEDPSVIADEVYATKRTYWVEPNSGALVDYVESMNRRFAYQGMEIPMIQGTLQTREPDPDSDIVQLLRTASFGLPLLRWQLPVVLAPLGLILLVAGVVLIRRRAREEAYDDEWYDDEPDGPLLGGPARDETGARRGDGPVTWTSV